MTALLTPTALRGHVETDLGDAALSDIIDSEEAEIIRRYGPHSVQVSRLPGGRFTLVLSRAAASITSVREYWGSVAADVEPEEYTVAMGGWALERNDGAWGTWVDVTYTPVDETKQRKRVLIDLCKLAITYNASTYETVGDYRVRGVDYTAERERLLRQLGRSVGVLA